MVPFFLDGWQCGVPTEKLRKSRVVGGSKENLEQAESHVPAFRGSRARALEEEQAELGGWRRCRNVSLRSSSSLVQSAALTEMTASMSLT